MTEALHVDDALIERMAVSGPRYTSYPTAPEWSDDFGTDDAWAAIDRAAAKADEPLTLYVHLPFCDEAIGEHGVQPLELGAAQEGGRTAAPVHLRQGAPAVEALGDQGDLALDRVEVRVRERLLPADLHGAPAVQAQPLAEGQVHVQRER